jgi:hypothetical protein
MGSIGLVGLGPAGCIFLACLPTEQLKTVHIFDSGCIGGDLFRLYGNVVANITREQTERALRMVPVWSSQEFPEFAAYSLTDCPSLADVCKALRRLISPLLSVAHYHSTHVNCIRELENGWSIQVEGCAYQVAKLVLCTGAVPKQMDLPKPSLPLEVALSPDTLLQYVKPEEKVVVFGTSHSGTLILRNLKLCGCNRIVAVYKGTEPFRWCRDGDTEGLKQESAAIADQICRKAWGPQTPTLISADSMGSVLRHVMEADLIIYAIGFTARCPLLLDKEGVPIGSSYNPETGMLRKGLWGFGIGFPGMYDTPKGAKAPDVGFGGFAAQILRCLPDILV